MIKYEFRTHATEDSRPIKETGYPWWAVGYCHSHTIIVCYLPENENLLDYWDDAFGIIAKKETEITTDNNLNDERKVDYEQSRIS